ncbi:MAG TPA: hypothetical protein VIY56_01065 [Vicinamibacterales bacterium]
MLHTAFRAAVTLSALGVLVAPVDLRADEEPQPRIVIRMYDTAAIDPSVREAAMRTTKDIVEDAGIAVQWMDCSRGGADHPCQTVRSGRELVVRIMPTAAESMRAQDSFSIRGTVGDRDLQLGFAAVDPAVQVGVLATMYYDRVQIVAERGGLDSGELLGRAMAHEVGHLLLRAAGHSPTGLMRAVWADEELTGNRREDWVFSPQDRRLLQAAASTP